MNENKWVEKNEDIQGELFPHSNTVDQQELKIENIEWDGEGKDVEDNKQNQNQGIKKGSKKKEMEIIDLEHSSDSELSRDKKTEEVTKRREKKSQVIEVKSKEELVLQRNDIREEDSKSSQNDNRKDDPKLVQKDNRKDDPKLVQKDIRKGDSKFVQNDTRKGNPKLVQKDTQKGNPKLVQKFTPDEAYNSTTIEEVHLPDRSQSIQGPPLENMKSSWYQDQIETNSQVNMQNFEEEKGVSIQNTKRQPNADDCSTVQIFDFDGYSGDLVYGICIEWKEKKQVLSKTVTEDQSVSTISVISNIPQSLNQIESQINFNEKSKIIRKLSKFDSRNKARIELKQGSYHLDEALDAISNENDMSSCFLDSLNIHIGNCLDSKILKLMQKLVTSPNRKEFYLSSSQRKQVKFHNKYFPFILQLCETTEEIVYLTEFEMTSEQFRQIFEHCSKVKKLSLMKCKVNDIPKGFVFNDKLEYKMERFEPRKAIDTKGLRRLARAITKNEKAQNSLKTVLVSKELKKAAENYLGEAGLKVELDLFLK